MKPIYEYINSKDIKKYLKRIKYKFNSLEAAWLIWQCNSLTFKEKKEAWLDLINTMPDCDIPQRNWKTKHETIKKLHQYLLEYIKYYEKIIDEMEKNNEGYIYSYSYYCKGDSSWCIEYMSLYDSFSTCLKAYQDDISDYENDDNVEIMKYRIMKRKLNEDFVLLILEYTPNNEVKDIFDFRIDIKDKEYIDDIFYIFEGLWFDFPTPFKKGDILWKPKEKEFIKYDMDGAFVLKDIIKWDNKYIIEEGDGSDMTVGAYYPNENGTIYLEVAMGYMDFEYYPKKELRKNEKVLILLSKYLKEEISLQLFLYAYREFELKVQKDDAMMYSWFAYENKLFKEIGIYD